MDVLCILHRNPVQCSIYDMHPGDKSEQIIVEIFENIVYSNTVS